MWYKCVLGIIFSSSKIRNLLVQNINSLELGQAISLILTMINIATYSGRHLAILLNSRNSISTQGQPIIRLAATDWKLKFRSTPL